MTSKYQELLETQLKEIKQTVLRPNVLLLGKTGAGKSTLANLVFGLEVFATGSGMPVTNGIAYFSSPETGIGIFDSKGYEFGKQAEDAFFTEVVGFATNPSESCDAQSVHLCWYCIPAEQERIYPIDIKAILEMRRLGIPTAVVITKSDLLSFQALALFSKKVKSELPPHTPLFKVAKIKVSEGTEIDALCDWSKSSLPNSLQLAFTRAQKVKLQAKKDMALEIVAKTNNEVVALALDSSDAALSDKIISRCMTMTAQILYLYEMEEIESYLGGMSGLIVERNKLVALLAFILEGVAEVIGFVLGSHGGRVVGKFVGKMLSSSTQSESYQKVVIAIGETAIQICSDLADDALSGNRSANDKAKLREHFVSGIQKRLGI